jgi:hypothetical protein
MLYHDHFLMVMVLPIAVMMPFLYHDGILSVGRYDWRDKADAGCSSKYQNKLTHWFLLLSSDGVVSPPRKFASGGLVP